MRRSIIPTMSQDLHPSLGPRYRLSRTNLIGVQTSTGETATVVIPGLATIGCADIGPPPGYSESTKTEEASLPSAWRQHPRIWRWSTFGSMAAFDSDS